MKTIALAFLAALAGPALAKDPEPQNNVASGVAALMAAASELARVCPNVKLSGAGVQAVMKYYFKTKAGAAEAAAEIPNVEKFFREQQAEMGNAAWCKQTIAEAANSWSVPQMITISP
jgi:hypothetical protein